MAPKCQLPLHLWRWGEQEDGSQALPVGRGWLQRGGFQLLLQAGRQTAVLLSFPPGSGHAWELASSSVAHRDRQELRAWVPGLLRSVKGAGSHLLALPVGRERLLGTALRAHRS